MTAIKNKIAYPDKNPISDNDFVVGTNGDTIKKETKSFPVHLLRDYLIAGLTPETGGTLKVTELVYEGVLTTPEAVANQLDPNVIVQRYEVLIFNVNGDKHQLKLQNVVLGVLQDDVTADDFIQISLVAENLSESISFYKGYNSTTGREEHYSIGSVGFSITKEMSGLEETGVILLEQTEQTNLGAGINVYKGLNSTTKKQEFYTLYSPDGSVTFTKELVSMVETGRIAVVSVAGLNFAQNDLTFSANRTHDLDSKTVYYNNAKQIKSNVNVIQPVGEASYEEKGFGTLVTDIIKRIYNSANALILEIRGDKSVKFFGNVWSNGLSGNASNTIFGESAFITNSTGVRNSAFGSGTLEKSNSNDNSGFGHQALFNLLTGIQNSAFGMEAGFSLTNGVQNTLIGYGVLNNQNGASSMNTIAGFGSGGRFANEVVLNSANTLFGCVYIGNDIKIKTGNTNPTNEIVIGNIGISKGNNTIVLGNSSSEVIYFPEHTTTEINAFTGMTTGAHVFNTTINTLCFYNGTTWQKVTSTAM